MELEIETQYDTIALRGAGSFPAHHLLSPLHMFPRNMNGLVVSFINDGGVYTNHGVQ